MPMAMSPYYSSLLQSSNSSDSNPSDEALFELSDFLTFSDTELPEQLVPTTSEHHQNPFLVQAKDEHRTTKSSIGVHSQYVLQFNLHSSFTF